ncbi:MAG: tetratricopeptide repeat protein [Alphaproteobacteria bacterium]|nr:tetratricopeptide repeat protein [Alphaproteobacteria bacterium]
MPGFAVIKTSVAPRATGLRGISSKWRARNCNVLLLLGALIALGASTPVLKARAADQRHAEWLEFQKLVTHAQTIAMMANPEAGMREAQRAVAIAERHRREPRYHHALAMALWLEAEALTRTNRIAQARATADAASRFADADHKLDKLDGDLALSRARIAESSGDFGKALREYQNAHAIFARLHIPRSQSLALLGLGDLYEKARDSDREIRYYHEAAETFSGDPAIALAAANNMGFAYEQMGRYSEAIPRFERALSIVRGLNSPVLEANILNSLARSYARTQRLPEAERAADRAFALAAHVDEDGEARFSWGAKAEIEFRRGNLDLAAADVQKAFRGLDLKTTAPPFRDLHNIAYVIYRAKGDLPHAILHLEAFKRLDDQGRSLAASANLVLLGAQFDFARQDLEIAHLRSAELERDIRLRKSQAAIQGMIFAGVIFGGLLLLGWIGWRNALLKRHRNAIAQKNAELMQTLAARDREIDRRTAVESQLRLAMQAAQQASRAKSHFLANMSHELRTPLNAIIGFSELLLGGRTKPEKSLEYAADIAEGGRHLLAILNSVLDMARIESGKIVLEDHHVSLGTLLDDAVASLRSQDCSDRALRILGAPDILVRVDEARFRQALMNLLSNAFKFSPAGSVVEVCVERTEDGVDIAIKDQGEGIPREKLATVVEPFGQAENTYARSYGGVGLGLPITKALVELHGGRFTLASEYGCGTIARIHLPEDRVAGRPEPALMWEPSAAPAA